MANINDFVNFILQIKGIVNYILVRKDGYILTHNCENPNSLSSVITFSGLSSELVIKPMIGLTFFKYLIYSRKNNEKLLIFPLEKYFLGIVHHAEAYTPDIVEEVNRMIDRITQDEAL